MKPTLTPQQYLEAIKPLHNPLEIKAVCEQLTAGLFNETDKPKTRVNKLTPYNKLINSIPNEELIEGENAYIQTKADGSLWKRHLHFEFTGLASTNWNGEGGINHKTIVLDRLENQQLVDVTRYLEVTNQLLLSDDPHELAVGLIAASGRRPVEILARGDFSSASNLPSYLKPNYFVSFRGQAKKRDYDVPDEERAEYKIGVLVPADSFLDAFRRFRKMPETKELLQLMKSEKAKGTDPEVINDMIESRRGNSLRRVVAVAFGEFVPSRHGEDELNNKALRAVYVRLITERDCPKNINPLLWASRAVGHFVDTAKVSDNDLMHLVTTLGYSDYYIDAKVPFIPALKKIEREKALQVRAFAADVEFIKNLQSEWELPNQQLVVHNLIDLAMKAKDLEKQLLSAQENITKLQKERDEAMSQVAQTTTTEEQLQPIVEKLVAAALRHMLPQAQQQSTLVAEDPVQLETSTRAEKPPKPVAPEKDWQSVTSEDLKTAKARGAAEEKIRRAFLAITNHNDHKARDNNGNPDNNQMWVVNNQALRQLSGCNGQLVADWIDQHRIAIDDHNNKYGLGQYHNKRHKQPITEVISW